ncbi:MAG: TM0106 family RecB-like putative nuclease [Vicinamibacterales bacterium]
MQRVDGRLVLSATDLSSFLSCRHRTGLDMAVADGSLARPKVDDPFVDALQKKGLAHETRFVNWLRAQGLRVVDVPDSGRVEDRRAATLEAMRGGADVIVQAALGDERWTGYADILRKVERPSNLGPWSYEAYDTKLARETRGGTILQLCLYSDLLEQVQGTRPEHFYVVTPEPQAAPQIAQMAQISGASEGAPDARRASQPSVLSVPSVAARAPSASSGMPLLDLLADSLPASVPHTIHAYRYAEYAAYYRMVKAQLLALVEQDADAIQAGYYPEPVEACDICRWWDRCNRRRRDDDHLAFIANISRAQRTELVAHDVPTLTAAAEMTRPVAFKPARGSAETYDRLGDQAGLQHQQRTTHEPCWKLLPVQDDEAAEREGAAGLRRLPEPSGNDVFLDLEGARFAREGGREYLFGLWTNGEYRSWFATTDAEEQAAFEAVMDLIAAQIAADPGAHVYHFNHYEPSAFKRLMGRYATRADQMDEWLRAGRFIDLLAVVREGMRAGVESYSIKQLEQYYGFTRDVDLRDVVRHLQAVELALEADAAADISPEMRAAVEGYNRDDCRSTAALRDWLEELRAGAVADGAAVPRPVTKDGAPREDLKDLDLQAELLRTQLLDGVPPEASAPTHELHSRWLLAYLVDWHRREAKAEAWEYYRLIELPEEDLLDEKNAITGLEHVGQVEVVLNKRTGKPTGSTIERYSYPPQEVEIGRKGSLKLQNGKSFGTIAAHDREARLIDIKSTSDLRPRTVLSTDSVSTKVLQQSVMRLAEALVCERREGEGGESAGVALLRRLPPRLRDGHLAPGDGESAADQAVRVVQTLDRTVLPIQGPPGAGKTYAGAHMIAALVAAGLKVGVTANSHKVIVNLLQDVLAHADTAAGVRVGRKPSESDEGEEAGVRHYRSNDDALAALASGEVNVFGGTAWLWADERAAGAVDVLFVDEAGQLSLASVLAVSQAANSLVLLGDPQQLSQPSKGSHPDGVSVSALEHVLGGQKTMPPDRGIFMAETFRLAPKVCTFTSELFYEGRLQPKAGLECQELAGTDGLDGAGLWWWPVEHDGNQNWSMEEVEATAALVSRLLRDGARWVNQHGATVPLTAADLRVVSPFNAQVNRLKERLDFMEAFVGTVDKFQGQTCAVVIYSMATSRPEDAPRGMEFLYSLNRLNVATSRARCAAIIVGSPRLLEPECRTPRQMQLANALCRFRELAREMMK